MTVLSRFIQSRHACTATRYDTSGRNLSSSATMDIERVHALSDNYVWLLHERSSGNTVIVDPSETAPVVEALKAK